MEDNNISYKYTIDLCEPRNKRAFIELECSSEESCMELDSVIRQYKEQVDKMNEQKEEKLKNVKATTVFLKYVCNLVEGGRVQTNTNEAEHELKFEFALTDMRRILNRIFHYVVTVQEEIGELQNCYRILEMVYRGTKYTQISCSRKEPTSQVIMKGICEGKPVTFSNPFYEDYEEAELHGDTIGNAFFFLLETEEYNVRPLRVTDEMVDAFSKVGIANTYVPLFYGIRKQADGTEQKGYFYFYNNKLKPFGAIEEKWSGHYNYITSEPVTCFLTDKEMEYHHSLILCKQGNLYDCIYEKFEIAENVKQKEISISCRSEMLMEMTDQLEYESFPLFQKDLFKYPSLEIAIEEDVTVTFSGFEQCDELVSELTLMIRYPNEEESIHIKCGVLEEFTKNHNLYPRLKELVLVSKESIKELIFGGKSDLLWGMKLFVEEKYELLCGVVRELNEPGASLRKFLIDHDQTLYHIELRKMERALFQEPRVPVRTVAREVLDAVVGYKSSGKIPNFVIMGDPGTGKSSLVKYMAKCFSSPDSKAREVVSVVPASFKGLYRGHTKGITCEIIRNAAEKNQIIFIDEAYNLASKNMDDSAQEALVEILGLLSGDSKELVYDIEAVEDGTRYKKTIIYNFEKEGVIPPPIWLGGYEHEMRKMLSANSGLYRRIEPLILPTPTVRVLFEALLTRIKDEKAFDETDKEFYLEVMRNHEKNIKNYFAWATLEARVKYFGNFAGVEIFFEKCKRRLRKTLRTDLPEHSDCIERIIEGRKKEIISQYKAVITDVKNPKFKVQSDITTTFREVKGIKQAVKSLEEMVNLLVNRRQYANKGIFVPKGVLLSGPPGTGKTLLARAVAGEMQKKFEENDNKETKVGFISVVSTDLSDPTQVELLFSEAQVYDIMIIFIDEIDEIGKYRNNVGARSSVLIQLLKEMDGFEQNSNLFVLAATNAPESLDPALKRPGRFDRLIDVPYPDKEERKEIIEFYLKKLKVMEPYNKKGNEFKEIIETISKETRRFSPSQLKNMINEAAILYETSIKEREETSNQEVEPAMMLKEALQEMIAREKIGELRRERKEEEFQLDANEGSSAIAIHEVGHALASVLLNPEGEPFEKVTVIGRGNLGGYVEHNSQEGFLNTKKKLLNQIKISLGGRVAEEMFYGDDISVGAARDIQQVTWYAENMLMMYGMDESIGPMATKRITGNYLGSKSEYTSSEMYRYEVDKAIRDLLKEQMTSTRALLELHKEMIEKLAKFVFEQETVTGKEFLDKYKFYKEQ